eukprot:6467722-Amphidinium_carterae.2
MDQKRLVFSSAWASHSALSLTQLPRCGPVVECLSLLSSRISRRGEFSELTMQTEVVQIIVKL